MMNWIARAAAQFRGVHAGAADGGSGRAGARPYRRHGRSGEREPAGGIRHRRHLPCLARHAGQGERDPRQSRCLCPLRHDLSSGALGAVSCRRRTHPGTPVDTEAFPYVRRRGPIAIVGVSTAIPPAVFLAMRKAGKAQLERLRALLRQLKAEGLFRVVLIHHPPVGERHSHRDLRDAPAVRAAALAEAGAELVLHGTITGPRRHIEGVAPPIPWWAFPPPRRVRRMDGVRDATTCIASPAPRRLVCDMESRAMRRAKTECCPSGSAPPDR